MDQEVKEIILRCRPEGAETLADLQKIIEANKKALDGLKDEQGHVNKASEEYQRILIDLKAVQAEYNQEMRISKKEATSARGSYNDLVNQLARLKEAWKQADPNSEAYKDYTKQINAVKDRLNEMDHGIGNWQRNVGNYANGIKDAFNTMGGATGPLASGINKVSTAFKAFVANPWTAIIGGIAAAVMALVKAFKRNEEATAEVKGAMAPLKSVLDQVKQVFDKLVVSVTKAIKGLSELKGVSTAVRIAFTPLRLLVNGIADAFNGVAEGIAKTAEGFRQIESGLSNSKFGKAIKEIKQDIEDAIENLAGSKLGKALGLDTALEKMKAQRAERERLKAVNAEIAALELDYTKQERQIKEANINDEQTILKLRMKSEDTRKSATEREKALKDIEAIQVRIAERNVGLAKKHLELVDKRNSLNHTGTEGLNEHTEAVIAVKQAENALLEQKVQNVRKESRIDKQATREAKDNAKEEYEARKALIEGEKSLIDFRLSVIEDGSKDELRLTLESIDKERELKRLEAEYKIKEEEALQQTLIAIEEKYAGKKEAARKKVSENEAKALYDAMSRRQEALKRRLDADLSANDNRYGAGNAGGVLGGVRAFFGIYSYADDEAHSRADLEAAQRYYDDLRALIEANQQAIRDTYRENQPGISDEELEKQLSKNQEYLNNVKTLADAEVEINRKKNDQIRKNDSDTAQARIALLSNVASATSSILGSLADMYEEDAEGNEKFANEAKNLRIASATIDTISGAISAFMRCQESFPQPYAAIIGAIQAAAVTATGVAQIAKIRNTKVSRTGGAGSGASVSAPAVINQVPVTRSLTSASEEERLNDMAYNKQRVILVHSDVQEADRRVEVVDSETEF